MKTNVGPRHAAYFAAGCIAAACMLGAAAQAVTGNVFQYSTPKKGYLALDPVGFVPLADDGSGSYQIFYYYSGGIGTGMAGKCFGKSVELPHGAKLAALEIWYQKQIRVTLVRHKPSDGGVTRIVDKTFSTAQTEIRPANMVITDPALKPINNRTYAYGLVICLPQTDNFFWGARVAYSYTTAGD